MSDFYTGKGWVCKKCTSKRAAEWKQANPEKFRESALRFTSSEKGRKSIAASAAKFYKNLSKEDQDIRKATRRLGTVHLSDSYVALALRLPIGKAPKELMQAKREQLQISRLLRELNKELKETK